MNDKEHPVDEQKMTHKELVEQAAKQLKRWHCRPICTEMMFASNTCEIPDAVGWLSRASIMFECKASRTDFLRDKHKPFRICKISGVGDFRFYLTNPDVIKSTDEIPNGWGVYEVINGKIEYKFGTRYTNACTPPFMGNKTEEVSMLYSWIRRHYKQLSD